MESTVDSQALMILRMSGSALAGAMIDLPYGAPLKRAYPSGIVPTGYPDMTAIVAVRTKGMLMMTSTS